MKKNDLVFILIIICLFLPFALFSNVLDFYNQMNNSHGMIMAFIKFAILATLGEVIALRIRTGNYTEKGFGILPRMLVWGFLGLAINAAFKIFASGTPVFLEYMGISNAVESMRGGFSNIKLLDAFSISTAMNLTFGIVMMTLHKITDTHIQLTGGTLKGFFSPINIAQILKQINWDTMWHFVYKKTIPFFWIPAHTITFLLPDNLRVLFAALLGIALGLILAIAKGK